MTAVAVSVNAPRSSCAAANRLSTGPYRMPFFPAPAIFSLVVNLLLLAGFLYENAMTAAAATVLLTVLAGAAFVATRRSAMIA